MEESCQSKSNSEVKPLILEGAVFVIAAKYYPKRDTVSVYSASSPLAHLPLLPSLPNLSDIHR